MKKKRNIIIACVVVALVVAVIVTMLIINKKEPTPTNSTNVKEVVLKENVIVITDETDEELQPYKIDENHLYFNKNPKYKYENVVVSGMTKAAPNGYIRRIIKTEELNGEFIVETEPATFLDVFEVLNFTATIELTEDVNGNFVVDEKTKNALSILPKLSLSATNKTTAKNSISKDKKTDDSTDDNSKRKNLFEIEFDEDIDDEVHIQGNASAKVWLELKIDIENDEITWSLIANDEIRSHILLGFGASLEKEFEKELFSKQLPNIQIMAGPIPIVITNEVGANLAFESGIAGEIGTSVDILQTSKNGFVYTSKDCSVKEINDGELNSGGVECTTGAKATGTAKAGVVLSLTSLFYDCSGAELGLGVEASAEGEIALNDKTLGTDEKYYGKLALAISPCISGNIIVQIPVIDDDLYEMEIFKVELKPFWEKVWENKDANKVVDVLSKDYSNELWWISYKDIIKTIKNSKESVILSEFIPSPGVVWKSVDEGGPGYGGCGLYWNLQNGDEMLYCLKESNQNSVPLLVIASKRNNNIKILSVYQFNISDNRGKYSRTIASNQTPYSNDSLVLLCNDGSIFSKYEWGADYIYYNDGNGNFLHRNYSEATDKAKLIQPEDITWISIKKWGSENSTTTQPANITTTIQETIATTKTEEPTTTKNSVTVAYKGVDWVSQESLAGYDVGSTFVSGTGIKYTVTAIEITDSGRQKIVLETTDGTKRIINNLPAFKVDSATGIIYYDIYNY